MKKTKKLLASMLAMMMAGALTIPAYAVNITIRDNSPISTYATERSYNGYKLLNLTTSTNTDGSVNYAYTVNEKYRGVLQTQVLAKAGEDFWGDSAPIVATDVTDAQILEYLRTLTSDKDGNVGTLRAFADDLYEAIATIEADAKAHNATFNDVEQGYWLIADVTNLSGKNEAHSLVVIDTKGQEDLVVTPKADVPEVTKKVKDENDSTGTTTDWQDGADYDIGDDVPFQFTGTVPSNIDYYESYKYIFHDDLSEGLTLNENSIVVKVGNKTLTKDTDYSVNTSPDDDCDFEIEITDLLALDDDYDDLTITKESEVIVEYTAKLTGDDVVIGGLGNTNKVKLEFSNNPYDENATGKTPEDTVTVFTFKLDVDKIDKDKKSLKGAGFTLYKFDSDTQTYVAVGTEVKGTDMTNFTWTGLDSGKYKLVETTVPNGYNKADDIEFTIEATYTTTGDSQTLTDLVVKNADGTKTISGEGEGFTFTATANTGTVATDIVNTTGVELPSTGGMGTTIFYVLGGLLTVGAAVLMVTKKRMSNGSED